MLANISVHFSIAKGKRGDTSVKAFTVAAVVHDVPRCGDRIKSNRIEECLVEVEVVIKSLILGAGRWHPCSLDSASASKFVCPRMYTIRRL